MRLIGAILQITLLGALGAAAGAFMGHFGFAALIELGGPREGAGYVYPAFVFFAALLGAAIGVILSTLIPQKRN